MVVPWQSKYVDPFTDYAFKMLFVQKRSKKLVKDKWDHQLNEMYHIWIMDHVFPGSDPGKMIHEIKLIDTETLLI